jgi:hypothetical protein
LQETAVLRTIRPLLLALLPALAMPCILAPPLHGGCFEEVSLDTLARDAGQIVVGRVRKVTTVMEEAPGVEGLVPFQEIEIKVFESWKGDLVFGDRVTLRFPGGTRPDGSMLTVSTSPATEDLLDGPQLLFIQEDCFGPGLHGLCHKALGSYSVERRPDGTVVVQGQEGHPVARTHDLRELRERVSEIVPEATQPPREPRDRNGGERK